MGAYSDAPQRHPRGVTLIELMVVVAIVGILAGIAGVSYMKQIKKGKIAQLKQYAMEIENGQKQYAARNGRYLSISEKYHTTTPDPKKKWEQLLEFKHDELKNSNIKAEVITGTGGSCTNCEGFSPDTTGHWYAIKVTQDMDTNSSENTTVYVDNKLEKPVVLNQGK